MWFRRQIREADYLLLNIFNILFNNLLIIKETKFLFKNLSPALALHQKSILHKKSLVILI